MKIKYITLIIIWNIWKNLGLLNWTCYIVWQIEYHDKSFTNDKYLHLYIWGKGTIGNGTFQNVSGETGHFYYLGNGTFYSLGEGTLYSLGNRKFYPLGMILSSGNWTTYPLGSRPIILWDSGPPLGNGTGYPLGIGLHLSSGKHTLGIGNLGDGFQSTDHVCILMG